ncbi:hypothetical protein C8J57DRAFT_1257172 [Mycena rebaudengoi]|nr:hypothetical protein C8J57DRAFT_1257172 [Mycena rebaudengoi]
MNVYTFGVFYLQGVWLSEFGAEIWNPCENRSYDGRNGCKPEGTDWVKVWGQVTGGRERVGSGSGAGGAAGGRREAQREAQREQGGAAGGGWRGGRRVARTGRGRRRRRGSTGREVVFGAGLSPGAWVRMWGSVMAQEEGSLTDQVSVRDAVVAIVDEKLYSAHRYSDGVKKLKFEGTQREHGALVLGSGPVLGPGSSQQPFCAVFLRYWLGTNTHRGKNFG